MARSPAMTTPRIFSSRRGADLPAAERRRRILSRTRTLAAGLALVGLMTGCGVRFETPPVVAPSPDANEIARQRTSADALVLTVLAAPSATDPADPVAALRTQVVAQADAHLDQLGPAVAPTERPGTPSPATPTESAAPTAPATAPVDAVIAQLVLAAASARADAASVPDGELARLLASVSTARLLVARQLAGAAGLDVPPLPEATAPTTVPAGPAPSALSALVAGEDEAGYGDEVIAAQLAGAARTTALDRAAVHRERAEQWARLAQIATPGLDPRRAAYALPTGLADPAVATTLAQTIELSLATSYASLLADADPASRAVLADALTEATAAAVSWGAPVPAFPGLPERATS
ncbi:MAG: DUF4439 domain-containing protein [Cellulomonas sp.]